MDFKPVVQDMSSKTTDFPLNSDLKCCIFILTQCKILLLVISLNYGYLELFFLILKYVGGAIGFFHFYSYQIYSIVTRGHTL